jgi:hypothetical protein
MGIRRLAARSGGTADLLAVRSGERAVDQLSFQER